MSVFGSRPPMWFWVVSGLLLLWGAVGIYAFYGQVTLSQAALAAMSDYDRRFYQTLPGWLNYAFALATLPGLAGAAALLMRSRLARPLFLLSLVGVVIQFGWVLGATDIIAAKGFATAAGVPIFIFAMAVFQVWFSGMAGQRRWLR